MNAQIAKHIESLELGKPQNFENMTVFPIRHKGPAGPQYQTMDEALAAGTLEIREVSEGGSVPTLSVVNSGQAPVLILDGEELRGAKQNRILNISILVPAGIEMAVPVSCTEAGRWDYESRSFNSSGNVMFSSGRATKISEVSSSVAQSGSYQGDQGAVWDSISECAASQGVRSPSSAMDDIYTHHRASLQEYQKAFACLDGQCGLVVLINGRCAGLDVVSRPEAYTGLHDKLVSSFAMDASMRGHKNDGWEKKPESEDAEKTGAEDVENHRKNALDFLERAVNCDADSFASAGRGQDVRLQGKGLVGSALLVDDAVLHTVFLNRVDRRPASGRIVR